MVAEVGLGDAVKFRLELGGPRGGRAERVELDAQVTVLPNGLNEGRRACDLAKVGGIGCGGGRWAAAPSELPGHCKKLSPGLVHGGRIVLETLPHLGHVSIVERGDDRQNGHECNVTSLRPE